MYKHILVPTDGSKLSLKAAKTAAQLARSLKARITTIYVIAPYLPPMESEGMAYYAAYSGREYEKSMRTIADKALAKVTAVAATARVKAAAITAIQGNPWEAIIKAASAKKCDLIVMASHGRRGLQGLLLGSETQKVLTHSRIPVLVCR
jgi:nucleotide-binding universal stress UspA family protein